MGSFGKVSATQKLEDSTESQELNGYYGRTARGDFLTRVSCFATFSPFFFCVRQFRKIPVTQNLDIIPFLVDIGTIGDWNIQGLPTDPLSIQNGILVTRSSR